MMERFDSAVNFIAERIKKVLKSADYALKESATEIRLRANLPVVAVCGGESFMVSAFGKKTDEKSNALFCSKAELDDSFKRLCNFSVHSFQNSIINGFITVEGGHRVGIVGTAVCGENGKLTSLRDISSLNVRIAREFRNSSDEIFERVFFEKISGLLIAGPPSSGKTTVLRDLSRRLSDFKNGCGKKVCVIDERGEIAAMKEKAALNDVGINCDVLTGYPKETAVQTALKTMSPEIIICDEISTDGEIDALSQGANSGTVFVATVHAAGFDDLVKRRQIEKLLEIGCFENVVLLEGAKNPGKISECYEAGEIVDEIYRRRFGLACGVGGGNDDCRAVFKA